MKSIIISFRGSQNVKNWITNLNTGRSAYSSCNGCLVHSGFIAGYNLVRDTIRADVQRLTAMYRGTRIIITGHSLGGAFAILAAADIKVIYNRVDEVYTFGQPRVGNAAFV